MVLIDSWLNQRLNYCESWRRGLEKIREKREDEGIMAVGAEGEGGVVLSKVLHFYPQDFSSGILLYQNLVDINLAEGSTYLPSCKVPSMESMIVALSYIHFIFCMSRIEIKNVS
jgi:hypothetical protein